MHFAGHFSARFFWPLFPQNEEKDLTTKSAKTSGGSKIKIRKKNPFCRKPTLALTLPKKSKGFSLRGTLKFWKGRRNAQKSKENRKTEKQGNRKKQGLEGQGGLRENKCHFPEKLLGTPLEAIEFLFFCAKGVLLLCKGSTPGTQQKMTPVTLGLAGDSRGLTGLKIASIYFTRAVRRGTPMGPKIHV